MIAPRCLPLIVALLFLLASANAADIQFARHYSNDMVLQRDQPLVIRGLAGSGAKVTLNFAGQSKTTQAEADGVWTAKLNPMPANAQGQTLKISSGGDSVSLTGVVIGDVILVARQTSVEISLGRDATGQAVAAKHKKNPMLRAISIKTHPAAEPQADLHPSSTKGWAIIDKNTALKMTGSAYHLGRQLASVEDVPIGIIDLNLGSAFPLSWLSREALMETEKFYGDKEVMGQVAWHDTALEAERTGVPMKKKKVPPKDTVLRTLFPSGGYNAVLHPMRGLALKAATVQLGNDYPYMIYDNILKSDDPFNTTELNTAYVECYNIRKVGFRMESKTTPRIARQWRKYFGNDQLPVGLIVPPGSSLNTLGQHHREMRELQRLVSEEIAGVDVILPGSENIPFSSQPKDEELLALRKLQWLMGAAYGVHDSPSTPPLFERMEANFNEATVFFKEGTAKGLKAKTTEALNHFEVANVEGDYSQAKATIDGETIKLVSDTVTRIMRVRYSWKHLPNQDLVNEAGLPVFPFRSEKAPYVWFVKNSDDDLPQEYFTPANEWKKNDVTLINGQLKTHGYPNFTGWVGPAGFKTGPFGPNMGVREIKAGSPAEGKLQVGDILYSANGKMLGDKAWEVMGAAITESETRAAAGKLVLGVRRGSENIDVEMTLEVMGTYSSTAPFDCPKTNKIIRQLEEKVIAKGAGAGFLNNDAIFMLATGNPEMLGYVRRIVYGVNSKRDPNRPVPGKELKSWRNSADAFLMGEYYLATGDKNVLPHLKHAVDRLTATQHPEFGGWRQNFPGGAHYGLIPNAGLPGVMGMHFATEAGLDIDQAGFEKSIKHYSTGKAETGFLIYGLGKCERPIPVPFDPETMANGKMTSYNGGISAAGILMGFLENHRAAHLCSMISAYSFNNTFGGHGGNFWNNFWTPLGAHQHSKKAFMHFWKKHRWYRECSRMFDGTLIGGGRESAGYGVALVAPKERIQIVGAPTSPFSVNAPEALKPALDAYWARNYAEAERLVKDLISSGSIGKDDMPTVEYFVATAKLIRDSIDADFARMERLIKENNPSEAKSFLLGLKGILPEGDPRLASMETKLAGVAPPAKARPQKKAPDAANEKPRNWQRLVQERPSTDKRAKPPANTKILESASPWKINVVEDMSQAPEGWTQTNFDDSSWMKTTLPISWRMYHTALLRSTFHVDDISNFDGLRFQAWVFRQQGIEIYLNGEQIGKINNIEKKTGNIQNAFKDSAMKHLRKGKNTISVTTRHNWRWGMLFMKVYNDGFDFNLDARLKDSL